jgi:hypothetical protein
MIFVFAISFLPQPFCQEQQKDGDILSFNQIHYMDGVLDRVFADFDLDGTEEYIHVGVDTKAGILLQDVDGGMPPVTIWHALSGLECGVVQAIDFSGDPAPEIFIPVKKENMTWIIVLENEHGSGDTGCRSLVTTEPVSGTDIDGSGAWDGMMDYIQLLEINGDECKDILAGVRSGRDKQPRGLFAFDGKSGRQIWKFRTAGPPCRIVCADVNNDGRDEIIFGTWSPGNGNMYGDMDDEHSYLICLNKTGELLWKIERGGVFTHPFYCVEDVNEDSRVEIISTYATGDWHDKNTRWELQILQADELELIKYWRVPTSFYEPFLTDIDRDANIDIVIANRNGTINVFDAELHLKNQVSLPPQYESCRIDEIVDMDQDGELEILASSGKDILLFNHRLELLETYSVTRGIQRLRFLRHPSLGELLSVIEGQSPYSDALFIRVDFNPREVQSSSRSEGGFVFIWKYFIAFSALTFIVGMVLSYFILRALPTLREKTKAVGAHKIEERRDDLLEALSAFGHGKTATANLDRLNLLFKNLPKDHLPSLEYRKKIDETLTTYLKFTSRRLFEIHKKSKQAEVGTDQLDSFERCLRKLGNLLTDYRSKGSRPNQLEIISQEVPATLESLEQKVEALKDELARYYSCDIIAVVQRVIAALTTVMKTEQVAFQNLHVEGDIGATGFIAETDFSN